VVGILFINQQHFVSSASQKHYRLALVTIINNMLITMTLLRKRFTGTLRGLLLEDGNTEYIH